MAKIYLAGHCLTRGSQLQRKEEQFAVEALGHSVFNPMDAEHNDKANTELTGLAERIVANDTAAINWSDVVIIEPLPEALGTHVELGQIMGMRDISKQIQEMINSHDPSTSLDVLLASIDELTKKQIDRKVYPHYEDIRRVDGLTETGDRRSLGINQYVYGVCLELTNGKGMYSMNEIELSLSQETK